MKFEMPQLSKKEKALTLVLAVLIVVAVYVFVIYIPVTDEIDSLTVQVESLQTEKDILLAKGIKYEQMKGEIEQLSSSPDTKMIPRYDNLNNVMALMNRILASASDYSIDFSGIKEDDENNIIRRNFSISFKCDSYKKAKEILSSLENCDYLVIVDSMTMRSYDSNNTDTQLPIGYSKVQVVVSGTFYERS